MKFECFEGAPDDGRVRWPYVGIPSTVPIPARVSISGAPGQTLRVSIENNPKVDKDVIDVAGIARNLFQNDRVLWCDWIEGEPVRGLTFYFSGVPIKRFGAQLAVTSSNAATSRFNVEAWGFEQPDATQATDPASWPVFRSGPQQGTATRMIADPPPRPLSGASIFLGAIDESGRGLGAVHYQFDKHVSGEVFERVVIGPLFIEFW